MGIAKQNGLRTGRLPGAVAAALVSLAAGGCSPSTEETSTVAAHSPPAATQNPAPAKADPPPAANSVGKEGETATASRPPRPNGRRLPQRTFTDLLEGAKEGEDPRAFGGAEFGHPQHDDARLAAAGIRKIEGRRLTVYTDLPRGDVDDFPRVFELAVPQWQSYFNLPEEKIASWRMTAYVINDKVLFRREGLIPDGLPPFQHGYQQAYELWVYEQPSDYYRRHLLLHEGTHGIMNTLLGGAGPPWYMEGVAELLATHRWDGARLALRYNPPHKDDVPYWGRVKIIRDDFAADAGMSLDRILIYDNRAHQNVSAYAWCWAACLFLDSHPDTQEAFRKMHAHVRLPPVDFNRRFLELAADGWNRIAHEQWFLFVQSLDYGSAVEAAIVHYGDGAPLPAEGAAVNVQADRGWQSSGVEVEAGTAYQIRAAGQFTIAREADGTPWPCEPGGVTLRYYNTRPLGELLLSVRDGEPREGAVPSLALAVPVGLGKKFTPRRSGTLYFKVNDSPAELGDNEGTIRVQVTR